MGSSGGAYTFLHDVELLSPVSLLDNVFALLGEILLHRVDDVLELVVVQLAEEEVPLESAGGGCYSAD